ncbi:MAG: L,D-transpeptidase [Proteobacteria bacterium]|nr:L,D-transpeptidase [Pseudomonadota bacterium]
MRRMSNIAKFLAASVMIGISSISSADDCLAQDYLGHKVTLMDQDTEAALLAKRNGLPLPHNVYYNGSAKAGDIIVNIQTRRLYLINGDGTAREYPISVGKRGYESPIGVIAVSRKAEDPIWIPTERMRRENRRLPKFVKGGHPSNPLGPRALYLGGSFYRIHGTIDRSSIGEAASKGCFRMFNEDVIDLYPRVAMGAKVTMIRAAVTPGITILTTQVKLKGPYN